ncbi:PAS domain-containing protein [Halarchaeum sp. CBA1220]|uniref:PAS domain-containing protein n=1 Tax=Halarchaeum sp. CBA1220 TaxID=1853682 RepID=UPI000F3A9A68|nr:PAS domain-containing protein [Halarchaeum sp. CBA1220]QLC34582.1 PAS domain-containing protein [Halarchaeum sp. CBA1220]
MEEGVRVLHVGGPDEHSRALADAAGVADVVSVVDGAAVTDVLSERDIDCIACEDEPDSLDAVGVLRRVRDTHPAIPFVLYASNGSEGLAADAVSAGATDYMRAADATLADLADALVSASRRYRAEQDVALLNDLARNVYERITEAFVTVDREWQVSYINEEAEALLEVTADRVVGENVWEVFPEAIGSTFYTECNRAIATQTPVAFDDAFDPLGKHFEVRAYPSEEGLSIHFQHAATGESTRGDHLLALTSVLSYDLADSIESARAALTATRAANPDAEGLEDVEAALDRMDDLITHSITLANEEDYSTTHSTG